MYYQIQIINIDYSIGLNKIWFEISNQIIYI